MKFGLTLIILLCVFSCSNEEILSTVEPDGAEQAFDPHAFILKKEIKDPTTRAPFANFYHVEEGWDADLTPEQYNSLWRHAPRPLLNNEFHYLKQYFPSMEYNNVVVLDPRYNHGQNCFAFSIGVYDWIQFSSYVEATNSLLHARHLYGAVYNYYPTGAAQDEDPIIYGYGSPLHASKSEYGRYVVHSKMGSWMLLRHTEEAIRGGEYGDVAACYERSGWGAYSNVKEMHEAVKENIVFDQNKLDAAKEKAKKISNKYPQFDSLFEEWKDAWHKSLSSHTSTVKKLPQYAELKGMGKDIIPLLVEKMAENENHFFILELYNELQSKENLIIKYAAGDPRHCEGLQQTAKKTVRKWLENQ